MEKFALEVLLQHIKDGDMEAVQRTVEQIEEKGMEIKVVKKENMRKTISQETFKNYIQALNNLLKEFNESWIGEDDVDTEVIEKSLALCTASNAFLRAIKNIKEGN